MHFEDATAVAFVVHVMIRQNCTWVALGDRLQGSENGQTPDNFQLKN